MVGGSLDNVNLMQSSDSPLNASLNPTGSGQAPGSSGHNPPSSQGGVHQAVQLNKKIIGTRKRNAREKSYDSYN